MAPMIVAPLAGMLIEPGGRAHADRRRSGAAGRRPALAGLASTVDVAYGVLVVPFALAGIGMA